MAEITSLEPLEGIDWGQPIQSQYSASPRIIALSQALAKELDNINAIQLFFDKVFNPNTAEGQGLDYWARIVGLDSRRIYVASTKFFGFYGSGLHPWDQAPFYNPDAGSGMVDLGDEALKWLIFYKAMANIGGDTMADMNKLLAEFVTFSGGTGNAYLLETGVMELRVVFEYALTAVSRGILKQYGFLNRGAGVGVTMLEMQPPVFGFASEDTQTGVFGEAPFFVGGLTAI